MSELTVPTTCAVVVLNWNGRAHLEHLLPSLYVARSAWGRPLPIVVVDNCSTAGDPEWLATAHPSVEVVVAPSNDYLFSLNRVVISRTEDVIIVLNNDMRVHPGFVTPLVSHFVDPRVFAVAAGVVDWEGRGRQNGQRRVLFRRFWCYHWSDRSVTEPCFTVEAGGGSSAYRRTYFAALGGFDRLYHPAYWEDFDLSYRGWMRGWTSIFEPRSTIYHRGSATMSETMPGGRMGRIIARNQLLFILKNVGGWGFAAGVLLMLPYRVLVNLGRRNWTLLAGTFAALPRLGGALRRRRGLPLPALTPQAIAAAISRWPAHPPATSDAGTTQRVSA
jgi:N-acetylglucosaminyl-diphospho-decaprenol L-rhamnosyltransferase